MSEERFIRDERIPPVLSLSLGVSREIEQGVRP